MWKIERNSVATWFPVPEVLKLQIGVAFAGVIPPGWRGPWQIGRATHRILNGGCRRHAMSPAAIARQRRSTNGVDGKHSRRGNTRGCGPVPPRGRCTRLCWRSAALCAQRSENGVAVSTNGPRDPRALRNARSCSDRAGRVIPRVSTPSLNAWTARARSSRRASSAPKFQVGVDIGLHGMRVAHRTDERIVHGRDPCRQIRRISSLRNTRFLPPTIQLGLASSPATTATAQRLSARLV